ncbi:MarR family winged helix-turn-helix transcriptional regulator [Pseudonocardia sp.]|uniref:MarR family winged helix-turn-helix transcriptional regulator n=1 Tax=Pseudonocardia sp. TaxID=60912 RepID=UPI003D1486B5
MTSHPALARTESLGYQVNHLARLLERRLRDRIAASGVVPGQFAQLLALYEADGLTQAELCARVQVEQPTMANTLARMERDGLITREPDPGDKRRSRVRLTPRAREIEPELVAAAREVNAEAVHGLPAGEVAAFMASLAAVIANLDPTRPGPIRPSTEAIEPSR